MNGDLIVKVQLLVTGIFLNAMGEDADNHVIWNEQGCFVAIMLESKTFF